MNHSTRDTLLIVDDIPENVKVLLNFLTNSGFKVLIAQDGERAIKKVEYAQPDLILLDVMMPGIDGFEVCRRLKNNEKTKNIPIIFMTALSDTVDKVKGFELGAADYITKPIQYEEVLARVTAHLNVHKLQRQLQTRNMELDAFSRTVAHDLKNPLSAILGYSSMLLEDCQPDTPPTVEDINTLQQIEIVSKKMINIIQALLLLAGVSKNESVETHALDMFSIIKQAEERLAPMLRQCQGEIIYTVQEWPIAEGYAPWIEEVWANYLSNALKYGGNPPQLQIGADVQLDRTVRFWVRDNGPGLSAEEQTQLFTPFTRLHTDRAEGHGLGLSIVQQVIEKLGGKAGVESKAQEGSLFFFTLPPHAQK